MACRNALIGRKSSSETLKQIDLARTALIETQQILPEDKVELLDSKWHLGAALTKSSNADHRTEAESILKELVGEASAIYGDTDSMTLSMRRRYATCLTDQEKYDDAIAIHEEIHSTLISNGETNLSYLPLAKKHVADTIIVKVHNQPAQELMPHHFLQLERADTLLAETLHDQMRVFGLDNIYVTLTRITIQHLRLQQKRVLDSPRGSSLRLGTPGLLM